MERFPVVSSWENKNNNVLIDFFVNTMVGDQWIVNYTAKVMLFFLINK